MTEDEARTLLQLGTAALEGVDENQRGRAPLARHERALADALAADPPGEPE